MNLLKSAVVFALEVEWGNVMFVLAKVTWNARFVKVCATWNIYIGIGEMKILTIIWDSQAELTGLMAGLHPGGGAVSPPSSTAETPQTLNKHFPTGISVIF